MKEGPWGTKPRRSIHSRFTGFGKEGRNEGREGGREGGRKEGRK
jgi:hypothetical protein